MARSNQEEQFSADGDIPGTDIRPSYLVDKENEVRMKELYPYMQDPEKLAFITKAFERVIENSFFERMKGERRPVEVLEIGAGDGIVGKNVRDYLEGKGFSVALTLSDYNEKALREAGSDGLTAVVADNKELPFKEGTFDIVVARSVTHYELDDAQEMKVLEEVRRSLKEGGIFIDQAPSFPTALEAKLWKHVNALVGRGANMKTTEQTEALLGQVFGSENVERAEEQPPKIHQDESSFVVRHRLESDAEKAHTREQVIAKARAMIAEVPPAERPDFEVSADGFAWDVTFTIFTCRKDLATR